MEVGYKKIFWGLIIASFNLKFGNITILPAFIGWIFVFEGLKNMKTKLDSKLMKKANLACIILMAISIILEITHILDYKVLPYSVIVFMPLISAVVELVLFHTILESVVMKFTNLHQKDNVDKYIKRDRRYIIFQGLAIALYLMVCLNIETKAIYIGTIIFIILRIYMISTIYSLKKENYEFTELA